MQSNVTGGAMHARTRELLEFLDAQRAVLRAAVDATPVAVREQAPAPGRWSAAGIVEHLSIVESRVAAMLAPRIADARTSGNCVETATDSVLAGIDLTPVLRRTTRVTAPSTAQPTGVPFDPAWAALEIAGEKIRHVVRDSDGVALGELTAPHPIFGPLNLYQWFAFIGAHEARHAAQIRDDYRL